MLGKLKRLWRKNPYLVRQMALAVLEASGEMSWSDTALKIAVTDESYRSTSSGDSLYVYSRPVRISWEGKLVYETWDGEYSATLKIERFNYGDEWFFYLEGLYEDAQSKLNRAQMARQKAHDARFEDLD